MTYVVYHIESTVAIKEFNKESSAKRSTTCMNRNAVLSSVANKDARIESYAYADYDSYNKNVVHKKKVVNLLSGKEVEIDSNTPSCCDPSTETYWSM